MAAPAEGIAFDPVDHAWRDIKPASIGRRANHLSTWTDEEMLVWGGYAAAQRDTQPPRGAAYDPSSDTWREIAPSPIRWGLPAAGAWTGSEWVIVARHLDGGTRAAAYDPATDEWRRLPDAPLGVDRVELAWTGEELVLTDEYSLFRMGPDESAWRPASLPTDLQIQGGPMFWTGSHLITTVGEESYSPDSMAAWDPATDSWTRLALAPHQAFGDPVWMDGRVGFFNSDLIYDVAADSWSVAPGLMVDEPDSAREGHVLIWTGESVVAWGGWSAPTAPIEPYESGYILTPDW